MLLSALVELSRAHFHSTTDQCLAKNNLDTKREGLPTSYWFYNEYSSISLAQHLSNQISEYLQNVGMLF